MADDLKKELEEDVIDNILQEACKSKMKEEDDMEADDDAEMKDSEEDETDEEEVEESYTEEDQPKVEIKDKTEKAVPGKKDPETKDDQYVDGKEPAKVVPGKKLAKESVEKMFEDAPSLSPDFIKKAETVFEAALFDISATIRTELAEEKTAEVEAIKEEMTEQVDSYLSYAIQEWAEENKLALVPSIRAEIAEEFLSDFKALVEKHNVFVPEDKFDLYEEAKNEITALEDKVNSLTEKVISQDKVILEHNKSAIVSELAEGLAATQVEKFNQLLESVETNDLEVFEEKAGIIRNSFFKEDTKKDGSAEKEVLAEAKTTDSSVKSYIDYAKSLRKD